MPVSWIEKIKQAAKNTWNKLKPKLPSLKTVSSYLWKIVVDGSARGFTFGTTIIETFQLHSKLTDFFLLTPFVAASIFRKIGKGSQHILLRALNIVGREFQKSLIIVPPLVGLCMIFEPQSSGALISIFCVSVSLSVGKRALQHIFKNINKTNTETENKRPSRINSLVNSMYFILHDLVLTTAKRAGQGALAKKMFVFFALSLYQDGIDIHSSWAAYTGVELSVILISIPTLTELSIKILQNKLSSNYKRHLDTAHLIHTAIWNGVEIWVYSTLLSGSLVANLRSDNEITPNAYIICLAASSIMGVLAGARHIYVTRSKQQAVAAQVAEEELVEITEPSLLERTDSTEQHSPRHANSSYQQLLPGLRTSSNASIQPAEEIPENEFLIEVNIPNDLSNASDSPLLRSVSDNPAPSRRYSFIKQSASRTSPQHSSNFSKASDDSDVDYHRIIHGNSGGTRERSPSHLSMAV